MSVDPRQAAPRPTRARNCRAPTTWADPRTRRGRAWANQARRGPEHEVTSHQAIRCHQRTQDEHQHRRPVLGGGKRDRSGTAAHGCQARCDGRSRPGRSRQPLIRNQAVRPRTILSAHRGSRTRRGIESLSRRRHSCGVARLEHDPENACPGLDPGWTPVLGKDHAPPRVDRDDDSKKRHLEQPPRAQHAFELIGCGRSAACRLAIGTPHPQTPSAKAERPSWMPLDR